MDCGGEIAKAVFVPERENARVPGGVHAALLEGGCSHGAGRPDVSAEGRHAGVGGAAGRCRGIRCELNYGVDED